MSSDKGPAKDNTQTLTQHAMETGADVAQREQAFSTVLRNGAGAALLTSTVAGGTVALLSRRWPPMAHVSLPFRAFGVLGAGLAAGVIASENTSVAESRRAYDASVPEEQRFSHQQSGVDYSKLSFRDRSLALAKEYRWSAVAYGWVGSMAASMYIVNRQPLDFKQKVVQARIYAQVITIVLLVAAGGLASIHTAADPEVDDDDTKEAIRERGMYKFKKGSAADKRIKHTDEQLHQEREMPELPEGKA